ncbi:uncharacterized protein LOC135829597 [Sycon ciliatum]|uniref:uncharacterized protein LOC135829597 n=1 Tax=Sycon ciliatum TaxID=27933 RepID=UPI0031F6F0E8
MTRLLVLILLACTSSWTTGPCQVTACSPLLNKSPDCTFDIPSQVTVTVPPRIEYLTVNTVCQQGSAPSCSSNGFSNSGSTSLHSARAVLVAQNASAKTFNLSAGGFANDPGNHTFELRAYDQQCRPFAFCWTLSVPTSQVTFAEYVVPSPHVSPTPQQAYSDRTLLDFRVPRYSSGAAYGEKLNLSAVRPATGDNSTLYTATWSVTPYAPTFSLRFESLFYTEVYGDFDKATAVSWAVAQERFGFNVSEPERNATHYTQTLTWLPAWPGRSFFVQLRRVDFVNRYPQGGLGFLCLYTNPVYYGSVASLSTCAMSVPLLLGVVLAALGIAT